MTFLQYEMPTLPFPDASFAAAFMGNVYCYSNPKSFKRYCILVQLREMEVFVLSNTLDK